MLQHSTSDLTELAAAERAARHGAGLFRRTDRGWLLLTGGDRASYLHGLLTNDITALKAGEGCYAAYLTAQGRMITDLYVYELGDVLLLAVPREVKDALLAKLDQFIFTEDVKLGDVTEAFGSVGVVGPAGAGVVAGVLETADRSVDFDRMAEHANVRARFRGEPVMVLRIGDVGVPGFELLIDAAHAPALERACLESGAVPVSEVIEPLRIEAGRPKFHVDMDEQTIPLEAGIEARAISMTKGCYVGQEVIVRVLHRGHGRVARKLAGLLLDGEGVPAAGSPVSAAGREIGRVTSAAMSAGRGRPVALAYLHRDFVEPGTRVTIGDATATVSPLPFPSA